MSLLSITGYDLVRCIKAGCIRLEHNRDEVDQLMFFRYRTVTPEPICI